MAFTNEQFPILISYGSQGGPRHSSSFIELASGQRKVTTRWDGALRRFDAKFGIKKQSDLYLVYNFLLAHNGGEHTFRFQDHLDYTSNSTDGNSTVISNTDQLIGVGDGTTTDFQLTKSYTRGLFTAVRAITLPRAGVLISVNGVSMTEGVDFTVNYYTGVVTIASAPAAGHLVKAGYLFDCHAQFAEDTDQLMNISMTAFKVGEIPSILIDEVPNVSGNMARRPYGGSTTITLTQDTKISLASGELINVNATIAGRSLWLPNPKGIGTGKCLFLIQNNGPQSIDLKTHVGTVLGTIASTYKVFLSLVLNADTSKTWIMH